MSRVCVEGVTAFGGLLGTVAIQIGLTAAERVCAGREAEEQRGNNQSFHG